MEAIFGKWKLDKASTVNGLEFLNAVGITEDNPMRADMYQRETQVEYSKPSEGGDIKLVATLTNSQFAGEKTFLIVLGQERDIESFEGHKMIGKMSWDGSKFIEVIKGPEGSDFVINTTKTVSGDSITEESTCKDVTMTVTWRRI